jgi:hypothetical protein
LITLSEEEVGRLLVGRLVSISVGEPWDFEGPDGPNALSGEILALRENPEAPHNQEVLLAVTPFSVYTGHTVDRLVARARYEDEVGIVEHLARGQDAEANLSYSEQVPEGERDPRGTPKLIGGVRLAG